MSVALEVATRGPAIARPFHAARFACTQGLGARWGLAPCRWRSGGDGDPQVGFAIEVGEIAVTECEAVNRFSGSKSEPPQFTRGYGQVFG